MAARPHFPQVRVCMQIAVDGVAWPREGWVRHIHHKVAAAAGGAHGAPPPLAAGTQTRHGLQWAVIGRGTPASLPDLCFRGSSSKHLSFCYDDGMRKWFNLASLESKQRRGQAMSRREAPSIRGRPRLGVDLGRITIAGRLLLLWPLFHLLMCKHDIHGVLLEMMKGKKDKRARYVCMISPSAKAFFRESLPS